MTVTGRAAGERDPARVVAFSDGVIAIAVTLLVLDLRAPADTIDAAGVRAITRRFKLALTWIGAATFLGALLPLLGVCLFVSFLAYYWTPVSGELGVARPRAAVEADEQSATAKAGNGPP
jgi:uncharacterized membrane protein